MWTPEFDLCEARATAMHDQLHARIQEAKAAGDDELVMDIYEEAHGRAPDFMACPPDCGDGGCRFSVTMAHGQLVDRVPYGKETPACRTGGLVCGCGAHVGAYHHRGCFREECPVCHDLLVMRCQHGYLKDTVYWEATSA